MADAPVEIDIDDLPDELPEHMTWHDVRRVFDTMSEKMGDWQGIPVPLTDLPLRLHDRHPLRDAFRDIDGVELELVCGGPEYGDDYDSVEEVEVNRWYHLKLNVEVRVYKQTAPGRPPRYFAVRIPRSQPMDRLALWVRTLGAAQAWSLEAEATAMEKLGGLVSDTQMHQYMLTGSFMESSSRSGLVYLFRRLRPTVAMSSRQKWWSRVKPDGMRCLAVLCLHPIGYYHRTWAGCMVPTDDVIAHLLFMRADEAGFWGAANQHEPWRPEAGL